MNASEKNSFEEQWRDAFENAELPPDPAIWATIETHLADAEANKYKRQLYVFKLRVAAAAALLILATGSWLVWQSQRDQSAVIAQKTVVQPVPAESAVTATQPSDETVAHKNQNSVSAPSSAQPDVYSRDSDHPIAANQNSIPPGTKTPALMPQADKTSVAENQPVTSPNTQLPTENTNGSALNPSTQTLAWKNKANTSRPATHARESVQNSISQTSKTPGVVPTQSEEITAETMVAIHTEQDSRTDIQSLTTRSIVAKKANMPVKDIRWQLNQVFWDQLATADAKEQAQKTARKSRWQIGAGVTPGSFNPNFSSAPSGLSYADATAGYGRTLNNLTASTAPPARTNLRDLTRPGVSYNTGIQAEFAISERLSIQGGVQYTYNQSQIEASQYIKNVNSQAIQPVFYQLFNYQEVYKNAPATAVSFDNTQNVYATEVNTADARSLNNTYQYMGFPMRFLYRVFNKKIKASVGAGVSADLFLRNRISSDVATIQAIEFTGSQNSIYKNMSMSGLLSLKLDYSVGNRYSIYLEPTYRRAITSFTTSSTLDSYPSWWGVGTGIQYRF